MKKIFKKELLIGALVLVALAILFFGIDFLKGVNLFHSSNYYYATYTNVEGLAISAPVTCNGFKVGQVREISYLYNNPGHVKVELSLDSEMKLPKGTIANMSTDMLGTSSIVLKLGEQNGEYLKAGDDITPAEPKGLMASVTGEVLPGVSAVIPKIDSLLTSVNNLAADPALLASIKRLDNITANLETSTALLNQTLKSMPVIASDVKNITGNFSTTSENLNQLTSSMKDIQVDSLMASVQMTLSNLQQLTKELNNPNSTLGLLTKDPALYNNLNKSVMSLDSLLMDVKANPKRYISIKVF